MTSLIDKINPIDVECDSTVTKMAKEGNKYAVWSVELLYTSGSRNTPTESCIKYGRTEFDAPEDAILHKGMMDNLAFFLMASKFSAEKWAEVRKKVRENLYADTPQGALLRKELSL